MLPFSAGLRNCIGEPLARLEMQIHVMMIARRLSLSYGETAIPELDIGVDPRSKHNFRMSPTVRIRTPAAMSLNTRVPNLSGERSTSMDLH